MAAAYNFSKLSVVNIQPLLAHGPNLKLTSVRHCIESLHTACRDVGFVGITGHNVPRELRRDTLEMARHFFASAMEEKNKIALSNFNDCIGYQSFGTNVTQSKRDQHEGLDYYRPTHNAQHTPFNITGDPWPSFPSSFKSVFHDYTEQCLQFGASVMQGIALSLRLDADHFGDQCNDSFYCLRILHYPCVDNADGDGGSNSEYGTFGCGEHRDYGCLTFINCDSTVDCLEIRDENGTYHTVNVNTVDDDTFVVNLGDMLHVWSGGLYQSTPHQVLPPRAENLCAESARFNRQHNANIGRISVPFFYEPNWTTVVKPITLDMQQTHAFEWSEHDKAKWKQMQPLRDSCTGVMYGDHLKSKVLSNFYAK